MKHKCHFRLLNHAHGVPNYWCAHCGLGFVNGRLYAPVN
jgi:hypothetical protein